MKVWYTGTFQTVESQVTGQVMEIDKPDTTPNHLNIPHTFMRGFDPKTAVEILLSHYKEKYTSPPNKKNEYKERFQSDMEWIVSRSRGPAWKVQLNEDEQKDKQIRDILKQKKVKVGKDGFLERSDV